MFAILDEDKMLMLGDFGRNTVQLYADSLEVYKGKMLEQEILFRNQVHELHRLYSVQQTLMKDSSPQQLECSSSAANAQLFRQATGFPSNSMGVVSWREPTDGYNGHYNKFASKDFGIQHFANQHVRNNGNSEHQLKGIPDLNSPYQGDASESVELRLSLNPEGDYRRNKVRRTLFNQRGGDSSSPIIIDLEDSSETIMTQDAKQGPPPVLSADPTYGSQVSNISNPSIFGSMKKDASCDIPKSSVFMEESKPLQDQNCYNKGFVDCRDNNRANLFVKKQLCEVDLNIALPEESSCLSDDTMIAHPSPDKSDRKSLDERSSIADNDSTSGKTIQSENSTVPASDQFSGTNVGSQVAEKSSDEQERYSFESSNSYKKKEELNKVDILIEQAAQSLVQISMEPSTCNPSQEKSNKMDKEEQPQASCDSYAQMVLDLPECCVEDDSVSSKPFEFSDSEKKDFGFKLRRGRRLKDFQRDILPGISTLSRHEIYEDITILEGVLRSREYKKMRSKMGIAENWSAPVRGRRSRASTAGRRR